MKARTKELIEKIENIHDFTDGQAWSQGGTTLTIKSCCRRCGITMRLFRDPQNDIADDYTFAALDGTAISMHEAAKGCGV